MKDLAAQIAALPPEKQALLIRQLQKAAEEPPALKPQPRTTNTMPLSFAQERQWVLNQWDPASPLYNITYGTHFFGKLDVAALEESTKAIVRRHEILRTTFTVVDNTPLQVIHDDLEPEFRLLDLSTLPEDERNEAVEGHVRAESQRPFDLKTGPLLRTLILRLGADEHVMVSSLHHSVFDGWSAGVLISELNTLLNAAHAGVPAELAPLPVQYADFAVWQRDWIRGRILEKQLQYWKEQLAGELPILKLPTDRPYPPVESPRGAHYRVPVADELTEQLIAWSRREGFTLNMILLGVWKVLLSRYTNQADILVGTPVANRHHDALQPLIGYFANTLVIRSDLSADPTFREFLGQVRSASLAAQEHQDLPFEQLVEALQPKRDLAHSPIFQVMFVFQHDTVTSLKTPELTTRPLPIETGTAKFALSLEATYIDQNLVLNFEYKTDIFDEPTIARMAGHFQTLLTAAIEEPEARVSTLPLVGQAERVELLSSESTQVLDAVLVPLHERFEAQARANPAAVALSFEDQQLTYGELNSRANQVARYLRTLGVGPDTFVGLCVEPSFDTVVGILAILKAGGAYVPIDPAHPQDRIAWIAQDSGVRLILTCEPQLAKLPADVQVILLDTRDQSITSQPSEDLAPVASLDSLAYMIYTSGSTGTPKGALITHRNVARLFAATEPWFGFGAQDTWTLFHSFAFDFSVWEIWGALLYGGRLVVVPYMTTRNPAAFHQLLCDEGVTVLNQTPSAFKQLITADAEASGGKELALRYVVFGGEALNVPTLAPWFARHGDQQPKLINMYGITETTVHVTYRPLSQRDIENPQTSPIGAPIPDLRLYVLDDHCQPVPLGVAGELHVGGAGLARGYWNRAELTAERFIENPFGHGGRLYKTGDLVRKLPNGEIEYLGRRDTQVKIRGFRIELGEIQAALMRHQAISDAVVVVNEVASGDQRLVAYLVTQGEQKPTFSQLRTFLKRGLPEYMVPASFIMLDTIPLTANGKIDYRALPAPGQQQAKTVARTSPIVAPTTLAEQSLAAIWAGLLGVGEVGIHDNFFELGGHSLLATQAISRIREVFNVGLNLRDFFLNPTVGALAVVIDQMARSQDEAPIVPLHKADPDALYPLSYAQQRIWFLAQMEPDSPFYTVPVVLGISGALNVAALEQALNTIVRRHHALRTVFVARDGQTFQQVRPAKPLVLAVHDISAQATQDEALRNIMEQEVQRPFRLDQDQLLRAALVKRGQSDHVLVLSVHHIAFDEWSQGVLFAEMTRLYQAFAADQGVPLAELEFQYVDFAAWQRDWLQGPVLQQQLDYWKTQLQGKLPMLEVPIDYPRPQVQTFNGAHETLSIDAALYARLAQVARDHDATLFMVLMSAWSALLGRYANQEDVVIGTPIANRNRQELEGIIGFFSNTLAIRTDLSGAPTFAEVIRRVRETSLSAFSNQDLPFDYLVSEILPERPVNRSPIFQAMLVLQNAPKGDLDLTDVQIEPLPVETNSAKFELGLVLYDQGASIDAWLEYNTDLFKPTTITRMVEHLMRILASVADDPNQPLAAISLVSEAEKERMIGGWSANDDDDFDLY